MPLSLADRDAIIDQIVESRIPCRGPRLSGGDEFEESQIEEMRQDAARERRRLLALPDDQLRLELEFSGAENVTPDAPQPRPPQALLDHSQSQPLQTLPSKSTKLAASVELLRLRYGLDRPSGVTEKTMLSQLNYDLRAAGKDQVSVETLRRAKKEAWPT
ncbi:hypothetical protein [Mesorhizobium sp. B1-1-5]|uniref:hypothetical protein n=1 Tax=Mesorhizobium sp. B1-1-5 TaxID=2589979 RepID=UPI00112E9B25|nr:hypothetical protein [Mesorhizobium sp. B1-1-5]TPO05169.1 hypothetical protein FJ980_14960 [Mesorhizobium sp. B1-1-5]